MTRRKRVFKSCIDGHIKIGSAGAATTVAIGAATTGTALFSTATGAEFPSIGFAELFSTAASFALSAVGSAVLSVLVAVAGSAVLSSACFSSASDQTIYKSIR